ncbi:MAG: hypothetical protein H6825_11015 [Planctomycetes bacterium]|nr:hypothetical protein [Planctomycetota bacterium]
MHPLPSRMLRVVVAAALSASPLLAQAFPDWVRVTELEDGAIVAEDLRGPQVFADFHEYLASPFFAEHGMRCGTGRLPEFFDAATAYLGATSDCSSVNTNPAAEYAPSGGVVYSIPVVWHVITTKSGGGNVTDTAIQQNMQVLNEDFRAFAGSLGADGTDARIEFTLAGITRTKSNSWYNDQGTYWNSLAWDTTRYLNIYTNSAGGNLGYAYVPSGGGVVGQPWDGVRLYWAAVGKPSPYGAPYHLGRTATHEVGHYLGLYHTFDGGCATASSPGCYTSGDLICDTNSEAAPQGSGSCSSSSCGTPNPTDNYMDYSDDACMTEFTQDQARRMRCTLANFRQDLVGGGSSNQSPSVTIGSPSNGTSVTSGTPITFSGSASDAEDGNLSGSIMWTSNLDGSLGSGSSVSATLSQGTHTVTAAVTDSGGAGASDTVSVTVTSGGGGGPTLAATIYKVKGKIRVDLAWTGLSGSNVEVVRDGGVLTTTANDGAYTDATGIKGSASFTYQVRETGGGAVTNSVTVSI